MPAGWAAAAACCCSCGGLVLVRRYFLEKQRMQQRYDALATADEESSDEDGDRYLDEPEAETPAPAPAPLPALPEEQLLDFSDDGAVATPACPPSGGTSTSAAWVNEMDAELAEFDALTAGVGPGGAAAGHGWQAMMEAELQQQLATPPAAAR